MKRLPYYFEKFDPERAPAFEVPNEPFVVWAVDGTRINGFMVEGPGSDLYVVAHGLLGHCRAPGYRQFVESLARFGRVIAVDLRGHGISEGSCTLGNKEALDLSAVLKEAKTLVPSTSKVTMIGFSMGAAAAIRASALYEPCDSLVAISSPAEWHGRRRWAAHRTALIWRIPGGTSLLHMLSGVRIEPVWQESQSPASVVAKLQSSLLVVHGGSDQFFPPQEARDLYERAGEPKAIWEIPEAGHAEGIFVDRSKNVEMATVHWFVDEIVERSQRLSKWQ